MIQGFDKFEFLPSLPLLKREVEVNLFSPIDEIRLFPFSSANPVFYTTNINTGEKLVIRGETQNGIELYPESSFALEKEIWVMGVLAELGLNVPKLFGKGVKRTDGYNACGEFVSTFNYIILSYLDGVAVDRYIELDRPLTIKEGLSRIAAVYSKVHSLGFNRYGFLGSGGVVLASSASFADNLHQRAIDSRQIMANFTDGLIVEEFISFVGRNIPFLEKLEAKTSYELSARLCLYDGSAGNMLLQGNSINLLDFSHVASLPPLNDFCGFIFCLRRLFASPEHGDHRFEHFFQAYKKNAPAELSMFEVTKILHLMLVDYIARAYIYKHTHRCSQKRSGASSLLRTLQKLLNLQTPSVSSIARSLVDGI